MTQHDVGRGEITDQIVAAIERDVDRLKGFGQQALRLSQHGGVASSLRKQDGLDHNGVDGGHHHAFAVMEPLEILRKPIVIHGRLQPAIFVALQHIVDDRAGFIDRDIAVFEDRHSPERVSCAVLLGLKVLRMKRHLVDLIGQLKLLKQPDDPSGPRIWRKMQFQHRL